MRFDVGDPAMNRIVARALQEYLDTGAQVTFTWHSEPSHLKVEVGEPDTFSGILEEVAIQRRTPRP